MLMQDSNTVNYADDNTLAGLDENVDLVITRIQDDSINLFTWFKNNGLKANPIKSHLLLNCNDTDKSALIENNRIFNENDVYLLGITFENNMMFEKHVSTLCARASQKLNALCRIACYMDINKRKLIMKQFILSQFGYCPLIWMCHSRKLSNRRN